MAHPLITRVSVLAVAFVCVPFVCCITGKAGEYAAYAGDDIEDMPDPSGPGGRGMPNPSGTGGRGMPDPTCTGGRGMPDPTGTGGRGMPDPTGTGGRGMPDPTGTACRGTPDPTELVDKALLCLSDKYIYTHCEEPCRLTQSGNLKVSPEYVDPYCSGPCLSETLLVLDCIEGIMKNFEFYNKATAEDVRDTVHGGCGHGNERGNFDVFEHIDSRRGSSAYRLMKPITMAFGFMIVGRAFWL